MTSHKADSQITSNDDDQPTKRYNAYPFAREKEIETCITFAYYFIIEKLNNSLNFEHKKNPKKGFCSRAKQR